MWLRIFLQYLIELIQCYIFIEVLVDHQGRSGIACSQATIGKQRETVVVGRLPILNAEFLYQVFPDLVIPHHPAAYAVTKKNDMAADGFSEQQIVKGCYGIEFFRAHFHIGGNVFQAFIRDPAAVMYDDFQRFDARGFAYGHYADCFFDVFFFFSRQHMFNMGSL